MTTYQVSIVAHGELVAADPPFLIPARTVIHTVPRGSTLCCDSNETMKLICEGKTPFSYHYSGQVDRSNPITELNYLYFDVILTQEDLGRFKTGIYVCKNVDPVLRHYKDLPSSGTTLRAEITNIYNDILRANPDGDFKLHINVVSCMGYRGTPSAPTIVIDGRTMNRSSSSAAAIVAASEANRVARAAAAAAAAATGGAGTAVDMVADPRRVLARIRTLRSAGHTNDTIKSTIQSEYRLSEEVATHYLSRRGGKRKTRKQKNSRRRRI